MPVIVITPAVPLLDAASLRRLVPGLVGLDDNHLDMLIAVAQQHVEPPDTTVGRSFGSQTLELVAADFAVIETGGVIPLPYPPITEIVSITYQDADEAPHTVAQAEYRVFLDGVFCSLRPAPGRTWPVCLGEPGSVRIRFKAGYPADARELMPVKHAVALSVQSLQSLAREDIFLRRKKTDGVSEKEWAVTPQAEKLLRETIERLLWPYRMVVM